MFNMVDRGVTKQSRFELIKIHEEFELRLMKRT